MSMGVLLGLGTFSCRSAQWPNSHRSRQTAETKASEALFSGDSKEIPAQLSQFALKGQFEQI